jgi:transposase
MLVLSKSFPEPDPVCGRKRRTTKRFREALGKQASTQPVAHVANTAGVRHHLGHQVAAQESESKGLAVREDQPLSTPQYLGIDEFATGKGHRSDTLLCDLEARRVLEVSEGRTREDVTMVLERLSDPDAGKVVSMDMSASFRPAAHRRLPKAQIVVDHVPVIQHVRKGFNKVLSR